MFSFTTFYSVIERLQNCGVCNECIYVSVIAFIS